MDKIKAVIKPRAPTVRYTLKSSTGGKMQEKSATPSNSRQSVIPDEGYAGLSRVIVEPIPSNYGKITYDGSKIIVS